MSHTWYISIKGLLGIESRYRSTSKERWWVWVLKRISVVLHGICLIVVQSLNLVDSLRPLICWLFDVLTSHQAPLPSTISWSLLKYMSIVLVMPSNHLILCRCFSSCLQSFPASGSFPMSQLFTSGGQSIGASVSASVLPVNIQDWFP